MAKNKLAKFADLELNSRVLQYPYARLVSEGFPYCGAWVSFFGNDHPLVLELGCGRGEYTIALARSSEEQNFIGIDRKGARMWSGATEAEQTKLLNAAFLRTDINLITSFFAEGEVDQIWITFPDPQMKRTRQRLLSTFYLERYRRILRSGGIIHLKTDSDFLYLYTKALLAKNRLAPLHDIADLYAQPALSGSVVPDVQTAYERQWIARGKAIKYLAFQLPDLSSDLVLEEPDEEPPHDDYRSFPRGEYDMRLRGED